MADLIVWLSKVVQRLEMIEEGAELRGKVLKHEAMVIRLFKMPYLCLKKCRQSFSHIIDTHTNFLGVFRHSVAIKLQEQQFQNI